MRARVTVFPIHREAARVRQVALALVHKPIARIAAKYFNTECGCLAVRLQMLGVPQDEIEDELDAFAAAVRAEIDCIMTMKKEAAR